MYMYDVEIELRRENKEAERFSNRNILKTYQVYLNNSNVRYGYRSSRLASKAFFQISQIFGIAKNP